MLKILRRVLVCFIIRMEEFIKVSRRMESNMVREYLKKKCCQIRLVVKWFKDKMVGFRKK